jgi:hypothetical protein
MNEISMSAAIGNLLLKEENKYINEMLEACNGSKPIKTYAVVREQSFEQMKEAIDNIVMLNPMMELAAKPIDLRFLDKEKWIALMVEYEENQL